MNASSSPNSLPLTRELAAALEWWQDAGVENDFSDDATAWLESLKDMALEQSPKPSGEPTPAAAQSGQKAPSSAPQPIVQRVDFFAEGKPQSLDAFREFWMSAPRIDAIGPRGRVPPRGLEGAEVMVLVVDPEQNDTDTLLSGPQGQLDRKSVV